MVSLRDISEAAGVSVETVSRVLNGQRKESWPSMRKRADRIRRLAAEMGYQPHSSARAMKSRKTLQVGALIRNDADDPTTHLMIFEHILGLNEGLAERGYVLSLIRISDFNRDLGAQSRALRERVLDGMVVICALPEAMRQQVVELFPRLIWMESPVWLKQGCLRRDEQLSGELAADAAIRAGYRKLIYLDHVHDKQVPRDYSGDERAQGVELAVKRFGEGVSLDRFNMVFDSPRTLAQLPGLASSLSPDTAIIANQAYQARFLAHWLGDRGITAPRDVGLCCCDDSYDLTSMWPGLSRARFDRYAMGKTAAKMMTQLLEQPDLPCPSRILACDWIDGNTLRPVECGGA